MYLIKQFRFFPSAFIIVGLTMVWLLVAKSIINSVTEETREAEANLQDTEGYAENKMQDFEIVTKSILNIKNQPSISDYDNTYTTKTRFSSSGCKLPILDPFDETVTTLISTPIPYHCSSNYPEIFTTDLDSILVQVQDPNIYGYHNCCYNSFLRVDGSIESVSVSEVCQLITETETKIPETVEFIEIVCQTNANESQWNLEVSNKLVVVDMFNFVHLKPSVEERVKNFTSARKKNLNSKRTDRSVNVVTFGIDAVSHMNFIRTFPKSFEYLTKQLSAYGLYSHSKVGENTLPNLAPALTGLSEEEFKNMCSPSFKDYFDNCPFIWKNYSNHGFRTASTEDNVVGSTFNYLKNGFYVQPTDYFLDTMIVAQEAKLKNESAEFPNDICYGSKLSFQILLDFLKQMAIRFGKKKKSNRYFQFVWSQSLTHNYIEGGYYGDSYLLETLKWFKSEGYFDNTVFILMSDHGLNFGNIMNTVQGKIENRMPFVYYIIPKWFQNMYSTAVKNLIENKNKLTTNYDLYETYIDLLFLENLSSDRINERQRNLDNFKHSSTNFSKGISLFLSVPQDRSCEDASIPNVYCLCRSSKTIDVKNNSLLEEGVETTLNFINSALKAFPQCAVLHLDKIVSAEIFQSENENNIDDVDVFAKTKNVSDSLLKQKITIRVNFLALPSNANFDAFLIRHTNGTWIVDPEIDRMDGYGNESWCINDQRFRKFCFCTEE